MKRRTAEATELLQRYYATASTGAPAYSGSQFTAIAALKPDPYSIGPADFIAAGIGRLSMTQLHTAFELAVMAPTVARDVVGAVAVFIDHGSEWG